MKNIPRKVFIREHDPKTWFFQSAITSTETIDFRINEKRNYNPSLAEKINSEKEFIINKIHFLIMRDATDDFESSHIHFNCRELEPVLWKEYFSGKYDLNDIIAYHWSEKSTDKIESFSSLVKIKYHKANWKTILVYLFVLGGISIFFNIVSSYIFQYFFAR